MIKILARLITSGKLPKNFMGVIVATHSLVELEISKDSFERRSIFQLLLPYTIL
jgi:hypothetical protein